MQPKSKPIVGFCSACPCNSGKRYGSCCFRIELAYFIIAGIAATVLFLLVDVQSPGKFAIGVPVVLAIAGCAGWYAKKRLQKFGKEK